MSTCIQLLHFSHLRQPVIDVVFCIINPTRSVKQMSFQYSYCLITYDISKTHLQFILIQQSSVCNAILKQMKMACNLKQQICIILGLMSCLVIIHMDYFMIPQWMTAHKPRDIIDEDRGKTDPPLSTYSDDNDVILDSLNNDSLFRNYRLKQVEDSCKNSDYPQEEPFRHGFNIFVDTRHKIVACLPPKSGCSTWKTIIANNSIDVSLPPDFNAAELHFGLLKSKFNVFKLNHYNKTMKKYFLTHPDYFKFMIARHPLERLLSAYVDKMLIGNDHKMRRRFGGKILKKYHPELSRYQIKSGEGVSLQEFLRYILSTGNENNHWTTIDSICQPCRIKYDFIIKTETMKEDNAFIIDQHFAPFKRGLETFRNKKSSESGETMINTKHGKLLPAYSNITQEDILLIAEKFRADLHHFGYSFHLDNTSGNHVLYTSCVSQGKEGREYC